MAAPSFDRRVPHAVHLRANERLNQIVLGPGGGATYGLYDSRERLSLFMALTRWYEGDPTSSRKPREQRYQSETTPSLDELVRGTIIDCFRKAGIPITGVVAERLGRAPMPTVINPHQLTGLINPVHPHAVTLGDLKLGDRIVRFSELFGPSPQTHIAYFYQVGNDIQIDVMTGERTESFDAASAGLIPSGYDDHGPRWSTRNYTVRAQYADTLPT